MAIKKTRGIDVSKYQNNTIDYKKAKAAGVDFAIIKIIQGVNSATAEPYFEKHYEGFTKAGIKVIGCYVYSYALTEKRAIADAQKVISILNGRKLKVWLDVEDSKITGKGQTLITAMKAFQKEIENAGLEFGIYTGQAWYNSNIKPFASQFPNMKYWIASYGSNNSGTKITSNITRAEPTVTNGTVEIWQYSSKGTVDGFNGNIDLNIHFEREEDPIPAPAPVVVSKTYPDAADTLDFNEKELGTKTNPSTAKDCVKLGQAYLNQALASYGYKLEVDGNRGPKTKAAEKAMLLLSIDLDKKEKWDVTKPDSFVESAAKYVTSKKDTYSFFNTFLEISCLLHGLNPNGVETPGHWGNGLDRCLSILFSRIINSVTYTHVKEILK